jgi:hypothetical protein
MSTTFNRGDRRDSAKDTNIKIQPNERLLVSYLPTVMGSGLEDFHLLLWGECGIHRAHQHLHHVLRNVLASFRDHCLDKFHT